ncbi:unnamed protein product, partial [Discosporangium mesarthrocarpum]
MLLVSNVKPKPGCARMKSRGKSSVNDDGGLVPGIVTKENTMLAQSRTVEVQPSGAAEAVVGAAVRGGSLLMLLALLQRASTFVLNILLQRAILVDGRGEGDVGHTSALEQYGAASITLELISSTALFVAREPFRLALTRSRVLSKGGDETLRRRFVNTAWLSVPVGLVSVATVHWIYPVLIHNEDFSGSPANRWAATLVCAAAALELMCEPLYLIFQNRLLVSVRVRAEAAAVLVLGVSRYLLVTAAGRGVVSFGYAQVLHSATLLTAYLWFVAREQNVCEGGATKTLCPGEGAGQLSAATKAGSKEVGGRGAAGGGAGGVAGMERWPDLEGWFDGTQLTLVGAMAGQTLLKHILTEGDKIVLARATSASLPPGPAMAEVGAGAGAVGDMPQKGGSSSLHDQGVYAVASAYGSLAARLLFQPVEEAARLMFSKLGAELGRGETAQEPRGQQPRNKDSVRMGRGEGEGEGVGGGASPEEQSLRGGREKSTCGGRRRAALAWETMARLLATLLKLVITVGLIFVSLGFNYTETLLRLLLAGRGGGGGGGAAGIVTEVARVLS